MIINFRYVISFILFFLYSFLTFAQTGPGGVSNNNGSADLTLWLKSDKNISYNSSKRVNRWFDNSGYGHHFDSSAISPYYTQEALNGLPALEFNSDGAGLERIGFDVDNMLSADENTFIFVKQSNSGNSWFNISGTDLNFSLSSSNIEFNYGTGTLNGDSAIDGAYHIVTGLKTSGGRQSIYVNGAFDTQQSNGNSLTLGNDDVFLGTADGTSSNGWQGNITEVLFFDRALDTTERLIIDNYLSAKYNLGLPMSYDKYEGDNSANEDFDFDVVGIGNANGNKHILSNSAGTRISEINTSIDPGEFVFIGHDNTYNKEDTTKLQTGVDARWARSWFMDKTGTVDVKISFDMSEGINGSTPGDQWNYVLLHRTNPGGTFDTVTVNTRDIENSDQIYFEISDANLEEGYYTLGTTDKSNSPVRGGKTWYSYYEGDWSEWSHWTLDPDGSRLDNPNRLIPGAADTVIILNGWQIDVNNNNKSVGALEVREGATLNLNATTGHDFGTISGAGKVKLATGDFPIGDATDFSNHGILEYNGAGYSVLDALDIKEMIVNLTATDDTLTLVDSVSIGEDLTIQDGALKINNASSTTRLNIKVGNDLRVTNSGTIAVGRGDAYQDNTGGVYGDYHQSYHTLEVFGDFINEGHVELTNLPGPDFDSRAANGAVSLCFKGESNNEFRCTDTTKLYNLVIDKGSDQTYELNLHSDDAGFFALFGENNNQWNEKNTDDPNPEMQKALWIKSGTLRLTGNIFIPSLTEGRQSTNYSGDYTIGADAALVVDDPGVEINNTANEDSDFTGYPYTPDGIDDGNSWQGLYVLGKFQLNDGYYWLGEAQAINFRDESAGELIVNGGELNVNQIAISSSATAGGVYSFYQTDGIVRLTGEYPSAIGNSNALLHLAEPEMTFTQKGGQIILENVSGNDPNGIYISSKEGNYSTTGGEVVIDYGGNFHINTTASFYDFTVTNGDVSMQTPLTVLNNLTIQDNQSLTMMNDDDLEIGRDFNLNNGATYNPESNTTLFTGEGNSNIFVENTTNASAITFNQLVVDKSGDSAEVYFTSPGRDTDPTVNESLISDIQGNLTLEKGIFDYRDFRVQIIGDSIINKGVLGRDTSDGRWLLNGTNQQYIEASAIGNPSFGHLENNNSNGILSGSDIKVHEFTFTDGNNSIVNIGRYEFKIGTGGLNGSNFGANKMFVTNGNSSAKGLNIHINISGSYSNDVVAEYPIGVSGSYTPAEMEANNSPGEASGFVSVNPVDTVHPANYDPDAALDYFWHVDVTGNLDIIPNNITYRFTYDDASDWDKFALINDSWDNAGRSNSNVIEYSDGDNIDDFGGFVTGDFTLGDQGWFSYPFYDVLIFYSRQDGNWDDPDTWSLVGHNGPSASQWPILSRDVVIIGGSESGPLDEDFENAFPPGGWSLVDNGQSWDQSDDINDHTSGAGNYARFVTDDWGIGIGDEGHLITPNLNITSSDHTLSFWINYYYDAWWGADANAALYLDVSNDNGNSWMLGSTNLINGQEGNGWFQDNIDLSNYEGQDFTGDTVKVRFRAIADGGDYSIAVDDVTGPSTLAELHHVDVTRDIDGNTVSAAKVRINKSGTLDITGDYAETCNFGKVEGDGHFRIANENGTSTVHLPDADFGDFLSSDIALFEYYGDTDYAIPSRLDYYPNLQIAGDPSTIRTLPNKDILVRKNLYIKDDANNGVILNLNNQPGDANLQVNDSLFLDNQGILRYPVNGPARTITVEKSVQMAPDSVTDANSLEVETGNSTNANHQFIFKGDMITGGSGITFYRTQDNRAVDLYFKGDTNSLVTRQVSGTNELELNNVYVDKDAATDTVNMLSDFALTNNSDYALHLQNGIFRMEHSDIDISLTSGDGDFEIPSTSGMMIDSGRAEITGASTGISLNGPLILNNASELSLDDAGADGNNYIEYSASGNAVLEIHDDATLTVGSQIRRGLVSSSGILKYRQTGGNVTLGKNAAPDGNRGVLEVLNNDSEFKHTGGNLIVSRGQANASVASVLIDEPGTTNISDTATLQLGDGNTPTGDTLGLNSSVTLSNVLVSGDETTAQLMINDLKLTGGLELENNTTFDANDQNVTLAGDFINSGTYQPGTNTTKFNGAKQRLLGDTEFYDMVVNSSDSLLLSGSTPTNLTVTDSLSINSAVMVDSANTITMEGSIYNSGTHVSTGSSGGMNLNGNEAYNISGGGTFGRVELDNVEGVSLTNSMIIQNNLRLTEGVFRIREYRLTLNDTLEGSGFGSEKMIQTSGDASNSGFSFNVPSGSGSYKVPIGTPLEYTPVDLDVSYNPSPSQITFKPDNGPHPTILASDSVLQYYWKLESSIGDSISANLVFHYQQSDVPTPYGSIELDYIPAYLYDAAWAKFSPVNVDNFENEIFFNFTYAKILDGEYTAGHPDAIPDSVPEFTTVTDGLWNNENIWIREGESSPGVGVPADGPNGFIVNIQDSVRVPLSPEYYAVEAYETNLLADGILDLRDTYGHYLGEVAGTGGLAVGLGKLPGGEYTEFFRCSGGAIDYTGNDTYTISSEHDTLRILRFSGSGTRTLPLNDLVICDSLIIDGPVVDNNTWDNKLKIFGVFARFQGVFDAGNSSSAIVEFSGNSQQQIPTSFLQSNAFYNLTLDNSNGLLLTDSVDVDNNLNLNNGIIQTADTSVLYLTNTANDVVSGVSSNNYIDGPLDKEIIDNGDFDFPVGNNGKLGQVDLYNTNTTGAQRWQARYYNQNPYDGGYWPDSTGSGLAAVSLEEYWIVEGPAGAESNVRIYWDSQSQIGNLTSSPGTELRIAEWDNSLIEWIDAGDNINTTDQTAATNSPRTLDEHAYTFASIDYAKPTVDLEAIQADICEGDSAILRFELTGESPWDTLIYHHPSAGNDTLLQVDSSVTTIDTLTTPGEYWAVKLVDNNGQTATDLGETVEVTTSPLPSPEIDGQIEVCENSTYTYTTVKNENSDHYYNWSVSAQGNITSESGDQAQVEWSNFGSATLTVTEGVVDVSGCESTTDTTVQVYETPDPNVTANPLEACYPDTMDLQAGDAPTGPDNFNYTWSPDSVNNVSAENTYFAPTGNPDVTSETINFKVIIENVANNSCSDADSIDVTIYRKPETGDQYYVPEDFDQ